MLAFQWRGTTEQQHSVPHMRPCLKGVDLKEVKFISERVVLRNSADHTCVMRDLCRFKSFYKMGCTQQGKTSCLQDMGRQCEEMRRGQGSNLVEGEVWFQCLLLGSVEL